MNATFKTLPEKKLIGKRIKMNFAQNKTYELWRSFMPRRKEIENNLTTELISMQVYDRSFDFRNFNPDTVFEKWAAVEVADFETIPNEMEPYTLTGGLYAVFLYKGAASAAAATFEYIFGTWLPNSDYLLDDREHFEILGEKYKNEDPDSEEELWIPIKPKN
ncbi:MAG TPA: GyrI-like domain-containing protein [Prolixibacteraceae bacterium]|jgi:AraC family transcriptional regulator